VNLQDTLAKSPRLEAWMELVELATGLFLLVFLQFHLLAVSSIILGAAAFNRDSARMDEYYLSYVGIPLVILAILIHAVVALRKAPWKFKEMRVFMQHSRRLAHLDTWAWLVQIVTGLLVIILAAPHVWSVLVNWPIEAARSAARIQGGYFSFFLLLLLLAEIHAMVGLYRILVKWSWMHRQKFTPYLIYGAVFFVGLGFITLLVFYFLKVGKALA
jgi:fumarate reductase subunit C